MRDLALFLVENPLVAVFLCLGVGYLVGKIKIGSFSFGATASTLIVAMCLSLWVRQYGAFTVDGSVKSVFFVMFTFVLGFEVGPSFFKAMRSSGVKIVIMAILYSVLAFIAVVGAGKLLGYDSSTVTGLFAGAFTQSAILGYNEGNDVVTVAYTVTYFVGTVASIIFTRYLTPVLLRVDMLEETKRKAKLLAPKEAADGDGVGVFQARAYELLFTSEFVGKTVEEAETAFSGVAEIELIYRDGKKLSADHGLSLQSGDVITVIGDISALNDIDEHGFSEVTAPQYFNIKHSNAQIVLTTDVDENVYRVLSAQGILIKEVERGGKHKRNPKELDLKKGDILHVYGPSNAINQAVDKLGYIKDNGITTDISFFSLALVVGLLIGTVSFVIMGKRVSLGSSFGALLAGLVSGWLYDKAPRVGHIAESTRWFIKSIGLNLYIAVLGLTSTLTASQLLSADNLMLMGVGLVLCMAVRVIVLYFSKYVLKLDTVDLTGGLCGSGTNTPALNAVTEYTGSSLYAISFAPGYAVGNIALITAGLILGYM